jgi:hypothetical protein
MTIFESAKKARTHMQEITDTQTTVQSQKVIGVSARTGECLIFTSVQAAHQVIEPGDGFVFKVMYRDGAIKVEPSV